MNPERQSGGERRYQRSSAAFPAQFTWGSLTQQGEVVMIGLGGCFMAAEVIVPVGEELEVVIFLEPMSPIRGRARVAWITGRKGFRLGGQKSKRGFALEFLKIFPEDRARIEDYVKRQTRLFRAMDHELKKQKPDYHVVKQLFAAACPGESSHLNHIRKVCREEVKLYRLRK